jgi:hypothetical protein
MNTSECAVLLAIILTSCAVILLAAWSVYHEVTVKLMNTAYSLL